MTARPPADWRIDPATLWHATRLGREEYVQRPLATLLLAEPAGRRAPPPQRTWRPVPPPPPHSRRSQTPPVSWPDT